MKTNIATKSAEQGYSQSRLPELTSSEVALIQGSADFLGVNAYTTKLAYRDASFDGSYMVPSYMDDMGAVLIKNISWPQSATSTIQVFYIFKSLCYFPHFYTNITNSKVTIRAKPLNQLE